MGLLHKLFSIGNPSKSWREDPAATLVFDLNQNCLNGVQIGEPLDHCSFLGPGKATIAGALNYPHKGLEVDFKDDQVECFVFFFGHTDEARRGQFAGNFAYQSRTFKLSSACSEDSFRSHYPEPWWRNEDGDEVILFYEWGRIEWQVEFGSDRRLKCVIVTSDLVMADASQRANYGVTKPWPPEGWSGKMKSRARNLAQAKQAYSSTTKSWEHLLPWRRLRWFLLMLAACAASTTTLAIRLQDAKAILIFIFGSVIACALYNGACTGRWYTKGGCLVERNEQPIRFWVNFGVWAIAYLAIVLSGFLL